MKYCENQNLKNIGPHIEGVYPESCDLCRMANQAKLENKSGQKKKSKYILLSEEQQMRFRNESILANLQWKKY